MIALVKDGVAFEGNTLLNAIVSTGLFYLSACTGTLFFQGDEDGVSYSKNYTPEEMYQEMAKRAATLLKRQGWTLYKST